jgi:hypothetical protein
MTLTIPKTWKIPKTHRPEQSETITPSYYRALYAVHLLARSQEPQFKRHRAMFICAALDILEVQGDSLDVDLNWTPTPDARAFLAYHHGITFDDRGNQLTPTREQIQESIEQARAALTGRAQLRASA